MPLNIHVLPALPGWKLLRPVHGNAGIEDAYEETVIGWVVEAIPNDHEELRSALVYPLTPSGESQGNGTDAIESPDGRITIVDDRDFKDKQELVEYWRDSEEKVRRYKESRLAASIGGPPK